MKFNTESINNTAVYCIIKRLSNWNLHIIINQQNEPISRYSPTVGRKLQSLTKDGKFIFLLNSKKYFIYITYKNRIVQYS